MMILLPSEPISEQTIVEKIEFPPIANRAGEIRLVKNSNSDVEPVKHKAEVMIESNSWTKAKYQYNGDSLKLKSS
jgi:hypothetical protein